MFLKCFSIVRIMSGMPPVKVWDASIELEAYTRQVVAKEIGRKIR